MLFYNVDHIEAALLPLTRKASSEFFLGSSNMCELFAHLENGDVGSAGKAALQAAGHFQIASGSFLGLAQTINNQYPWVNNAVKDVSFDEAARDASLSPDSQVVLSVVSDLLRFKLDGVLQSCANELGGFADRLQTTSARLGSPNVLLDVEYSEAHKLIADWRTLMTRGQFVSSACLMSARISSA
jgi:hypothetical protein